MNIEDCEVGMEVERFWDNHHNVKKGSIYTVAAVNIAGESFRLKETNDNYWYDSSMFRAVNNFEVGDEVAIEICKNSGIKEKGNIYKGKIWGIVNKKDFLGGKYGVGFEDSDGDFLNYIAKECELSPLKKPDELEVGDKFKANCGRKYKILFIEKDEFYNKISYLTKTTSGTYKGKLKIFYPEEIEEIIYN